MKYQQDFIAADQEIGFGYLRQCQELVVFGVATGWIDSHRDGILYYKHARSSAKISNEFMTFVPIEVAIELAAVDHFLYLSQGFGTNTEFREVECIQ
jgi:hypothetical protein